MRLVRTDHVDGIFLPAFHGLTVSVRRHAVVIQVIPVRARLPQAFAVPTDRLLARTFRLLPPVFRQPGPPVRLRVARSSPAGHAGLSDTLDRTFRRHACSRLRLFRNWSSRRESFTDKHHGRRAVAVNSQLELGMKISRPAGWPRRLMFSTLPRPPRIMLGPMEQSGIDTESSDIERQSQDKEEDDVSGSVSKTQD